MKSKMLLISFLMLICSCSSDRIVTEEKNALFGIFTKVADNFLFEDGDIKTEKKLKKTQSWLSSFKQPIILVSSLDEKNHATLIALGNNNEKLTWVSADGISLTYNEGVLIATRGFSEDLIALKQTALEPLFNAKKATYTKTHRYINGENRYHDIEFICNGKKTTSQTIELLGIDLPVDKFMEECKSDKHKYTNEYDLLTGTTIVVKSKQWISPTNKSFLTYNFYAFQKI